MHFAAPLTTLAPAGQRAILDRPAFTVVRNPFARALSAYLDKMRPGDPHGRGFCNRYGLAPRVDRIGFDSFLACLAADHPRRMDPHFRPQYVNTMAHHLAPDFIGGVEDMAAVDAWLSTHGIATAPRHGPRNDSAARLRDFYDDTTTARVREIHAEDFRAFGYSTDLADAHLPPAPPADLGRLGTPLATCCAAPADTPQPGTDLDLLRRLRCAGTRGDRARLARAALATTDPEILKPFAARMIEDEHFPLARRLTDRILALRAAHLDALPDTLLSDRGRDRRRLRDRLPPKRRAPA